MSGPVLSICIATLNRAAYIGETLESIVPQLDESTELVIVDGASTDATPDIIRTFMQRSDRIRYHRLDKANGVDRDYATAVELASGRYCWLFADDDVFRPDAIARLKPHLEARHSLIIVDTEVRNADLSEVLIPSRLMYEEDCVYEIGEDDILLGDTSFYLTFIGCVVIDRALWLSRAKEPYFGTEFIHYGVIFQAPLPSTTRIISEPLTISRYGNAMWWKRAFEIGMIRWPALVWSMPLPDEAKRKVTPRERWRNPLMLLGHRAAGTYSIEHYEKWIAPRGPSFLPRLIARIPGRPLNAIVRAALSILPKSVLPLFALDLRNSHLAGRRGQ